MSIGQNRSVAEEREDTALFTPSTTPRDDTPGVISAIDRSEWGPWIETSATDQGDHEPAIETRAEDEDVAARLRDLGYVT